jgi:hypothetical protein
VLRSPSSSRSRRPKAGAQFAFTALQCPTCRMRGESTSAV